MLTKVLIANRGEIACRVIRTCRRLGIATVAVCSEADRNALHVALADEAVTIGPAPSRESYLSIERIVQACHDTGALAVHPGYGFLSENEAFAARLQREGIVFIGPPASAIAAMGDKIASKRLAADAGVNTIPGWNEAIESSAHAVRIAGDIGYPVMVKASAGGGGKGLRIARDDRETAEAFDACRAEAASAFGDDRIFIEKYIENPRHIEIQVLADAHDNIVYLNERECSIQRRHQKVIEEAPSVFLDETMRRAMGEQAVALARAVGYRSAGTVEFVVGADRSFYFLEMNTRLQVEHPVTECITGLDLVEQMIRVASGEPLSFTQQDVRRDGWALECRINAEDPYRGFLPSTGRLVRFDPPHATMRAAEPPPGGIAVRVDTGVREGDTVSMHYDSMIAKLIVHAPDRDTAIAAMRDAVDAFVIRGVATNLPFHAALLAHQDVAAGRIDTGFIAAHYPNGFATSDLSHDDEDVFVAVAAALSCLDAIATGDGGPCSAVALVEEAPGQPPRAVPVQTTRFQQTAPLMGQQPPASAVSSPAGGLSWPTSAELSSADARSSSADAASSQSNASSSRPDRLALRIDGRASRAVEVIERRASGATTVLIDGRQMRIQVDADAAWTWGPWRRIASRGTVRRIRLTSPRTAQLHRFMPQRTVAADDAAVCAPMSGVLTQIQAEPGQRVRSGETLAIIEAMKMQSAIAAPRDGVVREVLLQAGAEIRADQPILRLD